MYIALDQIEKGDNPTVDDLALVSDAVELTSNFYFSGKPMRGNARILAICMSAQIDLRNTYTRCLNGAPIRLTGAGMQAVRTMMEHYYTILHTVPERTVLQLHRATELANIKSLKKGNAVILKGTK